MFRLISRVFLSVTFFYLPQVFAEVVVVTDRNINMLQPLADRFTAETGEKVTLLNESYDKIKERLVSQGDQTTVDVVFTKDLMFLNELESLDLLGTLKSSEVLDTVEPFMQSDAKKWTALTVRARTIVYNPVAVAADEITSYADLAKPEYQGRVCVRISSSSYNEALIGFFIETMGYDAAATMLKGWMGNLAASPFPDDTKILDAVAQGQCDIGVVNSYYLGLKLAQDPLYPVAIQFVEQQAGGLHTNGTGAGLSKYSGNAVMAEKFIAFLLNVESQLHITSSHYDYPARKGLAPTTLVNLWGEFKKSATSWTAIANRKEEAKKLASEVGY